MRGFSFKTVNAGKWRVDEDGFMRITLCVLRPGIFDYSLDDIPEEVRKTKPDLLKWRVRIPESAFTPEFLKSSEGRPVISWKHEWQEVENIAKDDIVGALAGMAKVEDGGMLIDAVINDKDAIAAIKSEDVQEVSAGYHSELSALENDPDADAEQLPTQMNHVVLLPKGRGRCGPSVRILNAKETIMVKVKFKNSKGVEQTYTFENEADAQAAEQMVAERDGAHAAEMTATNHTLESAKAEFAELNKRMQAMDAERKLLEEKIKQFESEEYQEAQSGQRAEYGASETAVVDNCAGIPATSEGAGAANLGEEIKGALKNAKTMNERRKIVTQKVCNAKGIPFDEANVPLLFGVLARTMNKASATEVRRPVVAKTNNEGADQHPIFHRKG